MLKKSFGVFGHFYSVDLSSGERIECRSVLEIAAKTHTPPDINLLSKKAADAVFIMMNPGSSRPLEAVEHVISEKQAADLNVSLVSTMPDTTQYQVMRLMHYCSWSHVRVLNLSDLRNPRGGDFAVQYRDIEDRTGFKAHSLFSDERGGERICKLKRKSRAPIVFAWGVSPDLEPLIERCLAKVSGMPGCTGLLKPQTLNRYFHPLPTLQRAKMQWVDNMVTLINS
ncbi:MAG: DUF1643 domain-containing protein [Proteobacteria bacterium]|nr:DUF1643 domain-containing protein [Pseudomonadota bacterium]